MLRATSALANWYLQKEAAEREIAALSRERDLQRQERQMLAERAQQARSEWCAQQEQAHARELEANDLRHRRETLSDRLREDYQIELAELYAIKSKVQGPKSKVQSSSSQVDAPASEGSREGATEPTVETASNVAGDAATLDFGLWTLDSPIDQIVATEEITELRRKLARLGSVSLDSLQELAELETRADTLETQYTDLSSAKRSLEEIIATINQDSRRLFTRDVCFDPDPFPRAVSEALRRRPGRHLPGGRERHFGDRDRNHRTAARQGTAEHLIDERRRKDAHRRGATPGHLSQQAEPLLHP